MKREHEFRYMKLANMLREQILSGYIRPGQYLLSENELTRHYGLSRSSVRKALDQLLEEGLIEKRVGQGTIVPHQLTIPKGGTDTLRILAFTPSYFADYALPTIQKQFQAQFPHVEVKILNLPGPSFRDLFETSRELGFQPDLLFVPDKHGYELIQELTSSFLPLEPLLSDALAAVYPKLLRSFSIQETVLAAPLTFSPVYLTYNPRMFERFGADPPHAAWTKDEFITASKRLTRDTDGDGINDTSGFSIPTALSRWPAVALRNGVHFRAEQLQPETLLNTLNFLHDILFRYRVATLASRSALNSEAFHLERTGMVLTTTLEMTHWDRTGLPFMPKIAPMPFGTGSSTMLIANALVIPDTCQDPELASQFIRVALDSETQTAFCRDSSFLSVLPSVNEALRSHDDLQALGVTGEGMDSSYFTHELVDDLELLYEIEREMDMFWCGLESAASFAQKICSKITSR